MIFFHSWYFFQRWYCHQRETSHARGNIPTRDVDFYFDIHYHRII
jgi:hypothetical protein